jgi:hypothetical protein
MVASSAFKQRWRSGDLGCQVTTQEIEESKEIM